MVEIVSAIGILGLCLGTLMLLAIDRIAVAAESFTAGFNALIKDPIEKERERL